MVYILTTTSLHQYNKMADILSYQICHEIIAKLPATLAAKIDNNQKLGTLFDNLVKAIVKKKSFHNMLTAVYNNNTWLFGICQSTIPNDEWELFFKIIQMEYFIQTHVLENIFITLSDKIPNDIQMKYGIKVFNNALLNKVDGINKYRHIIFDKFW